MGNGRTNLCLGAINVLANRVRPMIMGVKRQISSSSTAWQRTDDSTSFQANATKNGGIVVNDFDGAPIYADIITCDVSANGTINKKYGDAGFSFTNPTGYIMTYFPEFWYKRWQADGWEYIQISNVAQDGFSHSEAFYLGRYTAGGSTSAINTKSGVTSLVSVTLPNARTAAKSVGSNWGLMDIWRWSALQMLYLVEYADYNSQSKLGNGNCNTSAQIQNGGCDSLGMKSGCLADDKKHAVIYRGVENPFANIYQWLDGINISSRRAWVCRNRNSYESDKFASPYTQLGYTNASSNNYIKTLGYDSNNPEVQLPTAVGGSDSTYIPDYYYQSSGNCVVYVGGYWYYDLYCGLWYWDCGISSSTSNAHIGCRLLFTPV